jgi:hypothetical protein
MPVELQIALALISTSTVVGGFVFAAYQFIAFVRQRRQETALTLMKTTQPPELFSRSVRKIFELADDASPEAIHALGPELEQALIETVVKFENLGYLVYSRDPVAHGGRSHRWDGPAHLEEVPRIHRSVPRGHSDSVRMVRVAVRPHGAVPGRDGSGRRRARLAQSVEALGRWLTPRVDDHPTISLGNAATKTLLRSEGQQSPYLRPVDSLSLLADHREVPAAAIDELRQRSDTRITTTGFNRGDRRLRHPRALRKLSLRQAGGAAHPEE